MVRQVAAVFAGFGPADMMEMDMADLAWWHGQAEEMVKEMKGG